MPVAKGTIKKGLSVEQISKLSKLAGVGLTITQMAYIMDMSKSNLERRINDQKGVREALEKGRAQTSLAIRSTAFKMANSGNHPVMTIFWLKCREKWREETIEDYEPLDSLK